MVSEEREKLNKFLAQNGIKASAFSDAELRQQAQIILSLQNLKKAAGKPEKKKNRLSTGKNPGK